MKSKELLIAHKWKYIKGPKYHSFKGSVELVFNTEFQRFIIYVEDENENYITDEWLEPEELKALYEFAQELGWIK